MPSRKICRCRSQTSVTDVNHIVMGHHEAGRTPHVAVLSYLSSQRQRWQPVRRHEQQAKRRLRHQENSGCEQPRCMWRTLHVVNCALMAPMATRRLYVSAGVTSGGTAAGGGGGAAWAVAAACFFAAFALLVALSERCGDLNGFNTIEGALGGLRAADGGRRGAGEKTRASLGPALATSGSSAVLTALW
jgi:hypothetical protein